MQNHTNNNTLKLIKYSAHSPMHAIKPHEQTVWVLVEMRDVLRHDLSQQHGLLLRLRLDHVLAVVGVEEELARLAVRDELDVVEVA